MRLFSIRTDAEAAELVADRAWQAGAAGVWESDDAEGQVVLRIGVDDADAGGFEAALADLAPVDVTDIDGVELAARTVTVGPPGATVTLVVPPTVFGDGHHPTTAACLAQVARLVDAGTRVLDVGCGSGALSLVAARLGADVTAIDIDPVAVAATSANAAASDLAVQVSNTPLGDVGGTYEVVAANISAQAVIELAELLWARTGEGGALIVSGILESRWDEVRHALGGEVEAVETIDGWTTAVLTPVGS